MVKQGWILIVLATAVCGVAGWAWRVSGTPPQRVVLADRSNVILPNETQAQAGAAASPVSAGVALEATRASRFRLLRVVVPSSSATDRPAEALIAVDGLAPRVYRLGDAVVGAVILQSMQQGRALLGPPGGPAAVVLEVEPPLSMPAASGAARPTTAGDGDVPLVRPASAPAVDRRPVPVTDPDHGVDTSNH